MRTIKDMMYANVKKNSSDWVQSISEIEMILRGAIHDKNVLNLVEKYVILHTRFNENPKLKVKEGSLVMAKIFPKTHSILQPRFVGPLKV